ncbi:MAG: terpene cyclase/mutase family protein [Deltaproteobacteria bacterium]|nr:terpene cyclase/mutase family protein [Deltaproteobacteria bacterium]
MDAGLACDFLRACARPGGGWGYGPDRDTLVEPTASVVLALAGTALEVHETAQAVSWLEQAQHADGGWGLHRDDPESGWSTAWAVQALLRAGVAGEAVVRGRAWLASVPLAATGKGADEALWTDNLRIDPTLQGWPWRPDEASWVEPTAHVLLALEPADPSVRDRGLGAVRYLADRRCAGGGWNVGNPYMFGRPFPARAHPTAVAVFALARWSPATLRSEDTSTLRAAMQEEGGAGALAWGLIALGSLGLDDPEARTRLSGLQDPGGGWEGDPHVTALALRALAGGRS